MVGSSFDVPVHVPASAGSLTYPTVDPTGVLVDTGRQAARRSAEHAAIASLIVRMMSLHFGVDRGLLAVELLPRWARQELVKRGAVGGDGCVAFAVVGDR